MAKVGETMNEIICGDARLLSSSIPDNSIDLIFTDPPYVKEHIHLYGWLSEEAARVLKPDGFLLAYVGTYWKFEAMQLLSTHLTYYWDLVSEHMGDNSIMWCSWARSRYKSILVFSKHRKHRPRRQYFDLWNSSGKDKRFHHWGQDANTAQYYIDCFSGPGDTIWDPFVGGGTTASVCKQIGRNFIAFEIDPATADIARKRLETMQPLLIPELEETQPVLWEVSA